MTCHRLMIDVEGALYVAKALLYQQVIFVLFCSNIYLNPRLLVLLSVALLQFEVYLWLILAIKCFALTRGAWWIYEYFCMGTKGQFLSYFVNMVVSTSALLGSSTAGMWHIKITIRQHEYCLRLPKIKGHCTEGARNPASIWGWPLDASL